jgi:CelD/BcsL family acetyltransferase involved in cellulose biosynthesis
LAFAAGGGIDRGQALKVRCYDSFGQLAVLREEWEELALRAGADLFSTYDWCDVWWKHFGEGRSLRVYALRDGDTLVAVIPLFWEKMNWGPLRLKVLRLLGADHGITTAGFIIDRRYLNAAGAALARELERDPQWDLVHLGELPGYHSYYEQFAASLRRPSWTVHHEADVYPHMVIELQGSFDDFLQGLSASERSNIRRRERRVRDSHSVQVEVAGGSSVPDLFESFVEQHQSQWLGTGKLGHFGDWPGALAFHQEMAIRQGTLGRLLLMCLKLDGEPIGYHYNYLFNGRAHLLLSSRTCDLKWDSISPGRLLNCSLIRSAIDAGAMLIDALGGYYEHKRRLGAKVLNLQTITVTRGRSATDLRLRAFMAATRFMDLIYHRAWYWHLAPAMRQRFPRLVGAWGRQGLSRRFLRSRFLVAHWRKPPVDPEAAS